MLTSRQLAEQTRMLLSNRKQDIVQRVVTAAMHIIYDSNLYGSDLWPEKEFVAGFGIECVVKDRIYVGVNAYGVDKNPIEGLLIFNINNTPILRHKKQSNQIRLIMDQAFYDGIYFSDVSQSSRFIDNPWFNFKITI